MNFKNFLNSRQFFVFLVNINKLDQLFFFFLCFEERFFKILLNSFKQRSIKEGIFDQVLKGVSFFIFSAFVFFVGTVFSELVVHANFLMFITQFNDGQVDKVFENSFETFEGGVPVNSISTINVFDEFGSALNPLGFRVGGSDFFDFFDELKETVVKKFNFRLQDDIISKLDEFIDFFVLFAQNGLLTVNVSFFLVFLVMVTNLTDLDVVFNFELLNFLVNGNF
jgi:hypothetical protein